jgi:hypothetical protein
MVERLRLAAWDMDRADPFAGRISRYLGLKGVICR